MTHGGDCKEVIVPLSHGLNDSWMDCDVLRMLMRHFSSAALKIKGPIVTWVGVVPLYPKPSIDMQVIPNVGELLWYEVNVWGGGRGGHHCWKRKKEREDEY